MIEFQKRCLPHAHVLITLAENGKPKTTLEIDNIICAEIPDPIIEPEAYDTIIKCMIHGPCGHINPKCVCMINRKCSKFYPKSFNSDTTITTNGYPTYKR